MIKTADLINFRGQLSAYNSFGGFDVCFSHIYHNLAMFFLDTKIWMNAFKEHVKTFSGYISLIYIASIKMFSFFRNNFNPVMYADKVVKPFHNGFIDRSKFNYGSMGDRKYSCLSFDCIDVKTSVTVNVSSKVSKIQFIHDDSFTILYAHKELKTTVND